MNNPKDSLSKLVATNGRVPESLPQSSTISGNDEEKWDLGWLVAVVRRRSLLMVNVAIGTVLVAGGLLAYVSKSAVPQYSGQFQLLVEPITAEEKLARSATQAQGSETLDVQRIDIQQSNLDYETQIRILQSPRLIDPILKQIREQYADTTYESLTQNIQIARISTLSIDKREQSTKIIEVTYQDTDAQKVKFVLEKLSQAYLNYSLKERQSPIRRGIRFIDSQLPPLRQRVNLLQKQIQYLRQQYTLVDPEEQSQQLAARAANLGQQKADSQVLLAEAQVKSRNLAQQLQSSNFQSILGETAYYQQLLDQYQQVEIELAAESVRFTPENPAIQVLLEKRQNLQRLLTQEAIRVVNQSSDSIRVAQARLQSIIRTETEVNRRIQQLPEIARQYADLQRELAIATDSLNKFSTRQEALQIDAAQQEIPWELILPPKLLLDELGNPVNIGAISEVGFLALIGVLAIFLGIGVGFLVETTQDLLYTPDEVKRVIKLPVLGIIPHETLKDVKYFRRLNGVFTNFHAFQQKPVRFTIPGSHNLKLLSAPSTEAFRLLAKNIRLFTRSHQPLRSLTISSAEPDDGKSMIALHLALATAAMGQRVLLVDADLRNPQIHNLLGLSNQLGLINILTSTHDTDGLLQQSPTHPNLMVLTAGQLSVEPIEFFTGQKMELLRQKLQAMFELVIYDTPPLVGLADGSLLASQSDGVALVVRLGKTRQLSILAALEDLKFSSTNILGFIANDVRDTAPIAPLYRHLAKPHNLDD